MRNRAIVCLTLSVFLLACPILGQQPGGYPVKDFLGKTYYLQVEAAPDSKHIAFLTTKYNYASDQKEWTIWNLKVNEARGMTMLKAIAISNGEISSLKWSADGRYLAYKIKQEESPARLSVFDVATAKVRNVVNERTLKNGVSSFSWSTDGRQLYFAIDDTANLPTDAPVKFPPATEPDGHSTFYRIPASDLGKREPQQLVSLDYDVPLEFVVLPGETKIAYRPGFAIFIFDIKDPKGVKRITPRFACAFGLQSVSRGLLFQACAGVADGNLSLNAVTSRTQRRQYLVDPVSGRTEQLAPDYDGEFWARGVTPKGELLAIGLKSTKWTLYKIDPGTKKAEPIDAPPAVISHISVAGDGKLVAFATVADGEIYLAKDLEHLTEGKKVTDFNAAFNARPRPESRTVRWPNGDGDEVEGVLYFPPGKTDAKGIPAIVRIHGGPWTARSEPHYAPLEGGGPVDDALWLASNGYLVLAPNYRGGSGRGDKFLSALEGYPCSRPVADILPGVDMIVAEGWADPNRLGVTGGSYGGLLTNCLIGRTTRFKAAVTSAAIWNLTSSYSDSSGGARSAKGPWDDMRFYWEESPISRAGSIKTPTLIIHGGDDTIVNPAQARELNTALNRLRVPHELLIFPGEGHQVKTPSNDLTQFGARLVWFDHYLLGKPLPAAK